MAYELSTDLLYSVDHAWLLCDADTADEVTIGITEFAQEQLGDVVYLELPPAGTVLTAGEPFGEIESAKTVAELFAPVSGELIASNADLEERPELVNDDPYGAGWIVRARLSDSSGLDSLLDADAYREQIPEE